MVWLNKQEKTETVLIELKKASSGKGFICVGQDFDCFVWDNDKLLEHLVAAMAVWVDAGQGKQLLIKAESKEKRGFVVIPNLIKGKEVTTKWRITPTGYTCSELDETQEKNPFI